MNTSILNQHVLVLNKSWSPIGTATVRRALLMMITDQALAIDENYQTYDFESWNDLSESVTGGRRVTTVTTKILVPYVVALTDFNKVPRMSVKLSRRNIYARDNATCQYCGRKPGRGESSIDHVVPRSKGGRSTWENLVLACTKCNVKKADHLLSECGMTLTKAPVRPRSPFDGPILIDAEGRGFWEKFINKAYWNSTLEP